MKLAIIALILFSACGKRGPLVFHAPDTGIHSQEPETDLMTFTKLSQKVLIPKCNGCHKGFVNEERILKYVKNNNPELTQLFDSVRTGRMPKNAPPLSGLELEMVRSYIETVKLSR